MVNIDIHSLTFKFGRFLEQGGRVVVVVIRVDESFFIYYWGFPVLWFAPTYFVLGVECVSSEPAVLTVVGRAWVREWWSRGFSELVVLTGGILG